MPLLEDKISHCDLCGAPLKSGAVRLGCLNCLLLGGPNERGPEEGRFQHYEICLRSDGVTLDELGRGAMGITYRARDVNLDSPVALKIISARYSGDREARERFQREARAAAQLRHPNVASVFHFGETTAGRCFYAMELVEGETLEARVRREGPLPVVLVLEVAAQVARALIAAEAHGLVHRDLKPSNLMVVTSDGEGTDALLVKVIDFGLAQAVAALPVVRGGTHVGFSGTPEFASPEQFNPSEIALDIRSDIYSLGVTLWYLLSGRTPFPDRAVGDLPDQPVPLEQLASLHLPSPLIHLLGSMMAEKPAARPESARQLLAALQRCRENVEARPRRRKRQRLIALGLALLGAVGLASYLTDRQQPSPLAATAAVQEKSIAVLPFANLSAEQESTYLAAGVHDEILTNLAKIADLKVISRTSVMKYAPNTNRDLREIGRDLGVAYVLEGSVQRKAGRVRVSIQLLDTRTNAQVWAESYNRDLADVFAIQSDVALQTTSELQVTLSPREKSLIKEIPTRDLAAFDLYSRARALRLTATFGSQFKERFLQMVDLLNQAVARDPSFLQAWCELAMVQDLLYFAGYDHTPARLALADNAVQRALHLQPEAGLAHLALARHLYQAYGDFDRARSELAIARQTLPNNAEILSLTGYIDRRQERWAESTRNLERSIQLDPRNPFILGQVSINYSFLRDYEKAAAVLDRALAIGPPEALTKVSRAWVDLEDRADSRPLHATIDAILSENPDASSTIAADWLFLALCERDFTAAGRALASLNSDDALTLGHMFLSRDFGAGLLARTRGDAAAAHAAFASARIRQAETVRAQPKYAPALCVLGLIDAGLGQKGDALREGQRAMELLPFEQDGSAGADIMVAFAIICAWTGEKDLALSQLAIAAQKPGLINYGQLKLQPWWDPLRGDPRFEKIISSLAPKDRL